MEFLPIAASMELPIPAEPCIFATHQWATRLNDESQRAAGFDGQSDAHSDQSLDLVLTEAKGENALFSHLKTRKKCDANESKLGYEHELNE